MFDEIFEATEKVFEGDYLLFHRAERRATESPEAKRRGGTEWSSQGQGKNGRVPSGKPKRTKPCGISGNETSYVFYEIFEATKVVFEEN